MKTLATITLAVLISSCTQGNSKEVKRESVGAFLSSDEIATSFNDHIRSTVKTTEGTFHVYGIVSAKINADVYIKEMSNGKSYLCISGSSKCPKLAGYY